MPRTRDASAINRIVKHERTAGQFNDNVGKGQHQTGKGQYTDDDTDDTEGGTDFQAVFRTGARGLEKPFQPL
jgi:hypothetical protein